MLVFSLMFPQSIAARIRMVTPESHMGKLVRILDQPWNGDAELESCGLIGHEYAGMWITASKAPS